MKGRSLKYTRNKRQGGFSALEVLVALFVITAMATGVPRLYDRWFEHQATVAAAQHMKIVADAAEAYIKDNYAVVAANATPVTPAVITTTMMRATGHLPASFGDLNPFGQSYRVLVLAPTANKLRTLIVTEGGEVIKELSLRVIAKQIGAEGGYVSISDATVAVGSFAGWTTALAPYGVAPGAGHLATALFFQDGAVVNDYLYRHTVPGKPELQRMYASIDMNDNEVNNASTVNATTVNGTTVKSRGRTEVGEYLQLNGTAVEGSGCTSSGLLGRNTAGQLLTCQAGIWAASSSEVGGWSFDLGGGQFYGVGTVTNGGRLFSGNLKCVSSICGGFGYIYCGSDVACAVSAGTYMTHYNFAGSTVGAKNLPVDNASRVW